MSPKWPTLCQVGCNLNSIKHKEPVIQCFDDLHCCCRLYVLFKLPRLKFLDSSAFKDSDRVEARQKGPYLGIVRVADDAVAVVYLYDVIWCIKLLRIIVLALLLSRLPTTQTADILLCLHHSAVFLGRPIGTFIRSDIVTTISHERLEQFQSNWQGVFISPYWWPD